MSSPILIGSGDATHGARGTLTRQGADSRFYSSQRDQDLRWVIGGAMEAVLGQGVLSGCNLRSNGGLSCIIPAGARFFLGGAVLSLDADLIYNGLADNATDTVWATILRAEATQSSKSASDTWALDVQSNTNDVAPAAYYFRLARIACVGGAQVAWDNAPPGKFVAVTDWLQRGYSTIPNGEASYVGPTQQRVIAGPLVLLGDAQVRNDGVVILI